VRFSTIIFFNKVIVNQRKYLKEQGPLLLAVNHPNSFLDAVLLDILFKKPIWSLARGDVFKKPFYVKLLTKLKILPVYRVREGVENLETNYQTFDTCKQIFKENGIVLIFSEGLCINEWHLRPLKKGTARLAISSWKDGIPLKVLPVGINYSSFKKFGKNVWINFGEIITSNEFDLNSADGKLNLAFNTKLTESLELLVFEIPAADTALQRSKFEIPTPIFIKVLLFLPAVLGYFLHAPLYGLIQSVIEKKVKESGHYDSLMMGFLTFTYPFYVLLICLIGYVITANNYVFFGVLMLPFFAWAFVQVKRRTDVT
jgi:1-acyl-sn-glycerol-3-phosphate acyltransferase